LGAHYVSGGTIDWKGVAGPRSRHHVDLPTYPFQRRRYWAAPAPHAPGNGAAARWQAVVSAAQRQADQGPLDLRVSDYPAHRRTLDTLTTAYIVRTLRSLQVFVKSGERYSAAEIIESRGVAPVYRNLLDRWLNRLAAEGL